MSINKGGTAAVLLRDFGANQEKMTTQYNSESEVNNLKAQLKCAQSEIFFELKKMITKYQCSKELHNIINTPYSQVNYDKYTIGIKGERCYGVIDNVDLNKRHAIVDQVVNLLLSMKESSFWCDLVMLTSAYQRIGMLIDKVVNVGQLKEYLTTSNAVIKYCRARRAEVKLFLN